MLHLGQGDGHRVVGAKGLAARRALAGTVADEVLDAAATETVAAELESGVAKVVIARGI